MKVEKPWGYYKVLAEGAGYQIKELGVRPGQILSLQRHFQRREHWYVIQGVATVEVDNKVSELKVTQSINVPLKSWHRLFNLSDKLMKIIEIQEGSYLGEDDIERKDDIYDRV